MHAITPHIIPSHGMQATLTQTSKKKVPHVAASRMHVVFASSKSLYRGFYLCTTANPLT